MSIITRPSDSRFHVAFVGQTFTQPGFVQWLHRTRTGASFSLSAVRACVWSGNALPYFSLQIHLISSFGSGMSGTLCASWHAFRHAWRTSSLRHLATSTTIANCEPHSLGLVLEVGAVEGTLLDPGGRSLPGAVVSVAALDALDPVGQPALWPPVVTDPDGRFRVELLPPGRYLVHVRAGAARGDAEVVVERGQVRSVAFGPLDPRTDEGEPR